MKTKTKSKKKSPNAKGDFFSFAEKHMSPESVKRADAKAKLEILNIKLARLRENQGINQTEVPGFSQSGISKIEGREDIKISTLLQYLDGINMDIEITVHPKGKYSKEDEVELLKTGS